MRHLLVLVLLVLMVFSGCAQKGGTAVTPTPASPWQEEAEAAFAEAREKMVAEQIQTRGVSDPRVLSAMAEVPRHRFVPQDYLSQAYADHPLPIGYA